jgi:membrane fusion protein, multidrug efflux system
LQSAEINLNYTRIVSPISGRIGMSDFTEGALVTANQQTSLTSVQQLDPIYVDLTQSSDELLRLRTQFNSGALKRLGNNRATVRIVLGDGSTYDKPGTLEFADVSVSQSTGAITLRVSVPNPDRQLLPGMFVRAFIEQGTSDTAILAPQSSVQRGDTGEATAFVINENGKVEQRVLKTGGSVGSNWLVTAGLAPGDRLVVEGTQKIKAGDVVKFVETGSDPQSARGAPASGAMRGWGGGGTRGTRGDAAGATGAAGNVATGRPAGNR